MRRYLVTYIIKGTDNLLFLCTVILSVSVLGCTHVGQPGQDVLARYGGNELLREEINFFLPENIDDADSVRYAKQYIDKWIRDQVIVEKAKKEIVGLEKRIQYKLKNYESELITNEFAEDLIEKKKKDNMFRVTEGDILNYYTKYPERFLSSSSFYQFFYVKTDLPNQYKIRNLMQSDKPEKIEELREWAKDNANEFRLDSSYVQDSEIDRVAKGYYYGPIRKSKPKIAYYYRFSEGGQDYFSFFRLLRVVEPGDQLPLRICRDRIINSIKNQLIDELVKQTESSLIQSAKTSKKIKISEN